MTMIERWLEIAGATRVKPSGDNFIACCPFHKDHHRSFSMSAKTGQYICFSESCGEYGGLLSFLLKGCGYSYEKAKKLAEEYGSVSRESFESAEWEELPPWRDRKRTKLIESIPEKLLGLYSFCPQYLVDRGFQKEVLRRWEVGFDVETRQVVIPVRSKEGFLVGFTRRTTSMYSEVRYKHLNFPKGDVLYGEHFAKSTSILWVSEGQLDAIAIEQMGSGWVGPMCQHKSVSTMSANVSKQQIKLLSRYSGVVLAFDNDADGKSATIRVGDTLLEMGKNVWVARQYPDGVKDPADLLKQGYRKQQKFIHNIEPWDIARLSF